MQGMAALLLTCMQKGHQPAVAGPSPSDCAYEQVIQWSGAQQHLVCNHGVSQFALKLIQHSQFPFQILRSGSQSWQS